MRRTFPFSARSVPSALLFIFLGSLLPLACSPRPAEPDRKGAAMKIDITSSVFKEGDTIPKLYTGEDRDVSPPLQWSEAPAGTKSLALLCEDPDAPRGLWVHWVLFNLPADQRNLDAAVPAKDTLPSGARQGKNDFGAIGYGGPMPPPGKPHR